MDSRSSRTMLTIRTMKTPPPKTAVWPAPSRIPLYADRRGSAGNLVRPLRGLSRPDALALSSVIGVTNGLIDSGRDFAWTVPVAHAVLLLIPGLVIAAAAGFGRGSSRFASGRGCSRRSRSGRPCCGCRSTVPAACFSPPGWAGRSAPRSRAVRWAPADGAIHPGGACLACWLCWRLSRRVGR